MLSPWHHCGQEKNYVIAYCPPSMGKVIRTTSWNSWPRRLVCLGLKLQRERPVPITFSRGRGSQLKHMKNPEPTFLSQATNLQLRCKSLQSIIRPKSCSSKRSRAALWTLSWICRSSMISSLRREIGWHPFPGSCNGRLVFDVFWIIIQSSRLAPISKEGVAWDSPVCATDTLGHSAAERGNDGPGLFKGGTEANPNCRTEAND